MLVFYLLLVVVGGVAMYVSIFKTQVVNGDMWRKKAESRERIERTEEARRGTIFSSDDKVLATTVPGSWQMAQDDGCRGQETSQTIRSLFGARP